MRRGLFTLLLGLLFGCPGLGSGVVEVGGVNTWEDNIQDLLLTNCVPCHTDPPNNGAPDSFRLDVYDRAEAGGGKDGAFEKRARILERAVRNLPRAMPPPNNPEGVRSPLSAENKATLQAWIEAGAPRRAEAGS